MPPFYLKGRWAGIDKFGVGSKLANTTQRALPAERLAAADILAGVEQFSKQGIQCSVFGFGIGTYNDEMLETLADKGDGAYTFIDSEDEARRVFIDDLERNVQAAADAGMHAVHYTSYPQLLEDLRGLGVSC